MEGDQLQPLVAILASVAHIARHLFRPVPVIIMNFTRRKKYQDPALPTVPGQQHLPSYAKERKLSSLVPMWALTPSAVSRSYAIDCRWWHIIAAEKLGEQPRSIAHLHTFLNDENEAPFFQMFAWYTSSARITNFSSTAICLD